MYSFMMSREVCIFGRLPKGKIVLDVVAFTRLILHQQPSQKVPAAPSEKDIGQGNLTCENVGQWGEGKKEKRVKKGRIHLDQA